MTALHDSSLFAADIVMLLWSQLIRHVCVSLAQPPTLTHQQPCVVESSVSGEHYPRVVRLNCTPIASALARLYCSPTASDSAAVH